MWLHFLLMGILVIAALASNELWRDGRKNHLVLLVTFVVFLVIASIRTESVGSDTPNYAKFFYNVLACNNFGDAFAVSRFEVGFAAVTFLLTRITDSFNVYLLVLCAFYYGCVVSFIGKYGKSYGTAVLIAFGLTVFYDPLITLRQSVSIGFFLIAFRDLLHRKALRYFVLIAIACSFHISAIILVPVYFFPAIKLSKASDCVKWLGLIALACALEGVALKIAGIVFPYYAHYFDTDYAGGGVRAASMLLLGSRLVLLLLACLSNWRAYQKQDESNPIVGKLNMLLLMDVLVAALSLSFNLLDRLEGYFAVSFVVAISNAINFKRNREGRICDLLAILVSFAYITALLVFRGEWFGIFPFEVVF